MSPMVTPRPDSSPPSNFEEYPLMFSIPEGNPGDWRCRQNLKTGGRQNRRDLHKKASVIFHKNTVWTRQFV